MSGRRSGRTQIGSATGAGHGKLRGIGSGPKIEAGRRQVSATPAGNVGARLLHGSQGGAKVGIVPGGSLLHFWEGWQRNARVKIFGKFKVVVEIGKNQHRKIEPGVQEPELRFEQLATAVLHLQLRLDDVGMSYFPALFE